MNQNNIVRMFQQLKKGGGGGGGGGGPTVVQPKKRTTTVPAVAIGARRRPCWNDYQRALDKIDNLKIQLPLFGSDRMSDQFFKLLDPAPEQQQQQQHQDEEATYDNECSLNSGSLGSNSQSSVDSVLTGDAATLQRGPVVSLADQFYTYSFTQLVERFVLRALVSPFDVDVEYTAASSTAAADDDDDNDATIVYHQTATTDRRARTTIVSRGLSSYLERAQNLFGRGAAGMVQLKQVPSFRIEMPANGAFVTPGRGGGGGSGKKKRSRRTATPPSDNILVTVHQDMCRKYHAICIAQNMLISRPFCGCCVSAIRIFVFDHVQPQHQLTGSGGFDVIQFARATQQTHVLVNVADVLYRSLPAIEFSENFDMGVVHRGVSARLYRDQSRCATLKTAALQRTAFYRRVYAVHAAVYALASWLWYRQAARHMDFCQRRVLTDVPPVMLTVNKNLAQIFTRVNTVFLQLLLQRQRLFYEFV